MKWDEWSRVLAVFSLQSRKEEEALLNLELQVKSLYLALLVVDVDDDDDDDDDDDTLGFQAYERGATGS